MPRMCSARRHFCSVRASLVSASQSAKRTDHTHIQLILRISHRLIFFPKKVFSTRAPRASPSSRPPLRAARFRCRWGAIGRGRAPRGALTRGDGVCAPLLSALWD